MNDFKDDAVQDDLDVEITDLEPIEGASRLSRTLLAWEGRPSSLRRRTRHIVAVCSSFLFIFLVIFGTFPSAREMASSMLSRLSAAHSIGKVTATATPEATNVFDAKEVIIWNTHTTTTITPSDILDPAPQNCPAISQTQGFDYTGGPRVAGSPPVLVIGFGGTDAILTHFKHAQPPEIGWYRRIILLTETNYTGTITLQGGGLHGVSPIWFGMRPHNQGPITSFTLRPRDASRSNHTRGDEAWGLSSATMFVPRAGCYFLTATWAEGWWIVFFSAGR
jgi:hypothetical protein